jgi:hypothetical protein
LLAVAVAVVGRVLVLVQVVIEHQQAHLVETLQQNLHLVLLLELFIHLPLVLVVQVVLMLIQILEQMEETLFWAALLLLVAVAVKVTHRV